MSDFNLNHFVVVAQQNRVTPSPLDFRLWTLDLDCDNFINISFPQHSFMNIDAGVE